MNTLITTRAGWLIVGLSVLPLIPAAAGPRPSQPQEERLEWLLAAHDVRYVMHASPAARSDSGDCKAAEHSQ